MLGKMRTANARRAHLRASSSVRASVIREDLCVSLTAYESSNGSEWRDRCVVQRMAAAGVTLASVRSDEEVRLHLSKHKVATSGPVEKVIETNVRPTPISIFRAPVDLHRPYPKERIASIEPDFHSAMRAESIGSLIRLEAFHSLFSVALLRSMIVPALATMNRRSRRSGRVRDNVLRPTMRTRFSN